MHKSKPGIEFRQMIDRIVKIVAEEKNHINDAKDLALIIEQNFAKELVAELIAHLPTSKNVFLNLGLNLLPFNAGMIAGGIKDYVELAISKRNWVSILNI